MFALFSAAAQAHTDFESSMNERIATLQSSISQQQKDLMEKSDQVEAVQEQLESANEESDKLRREITQVCALFLSRNFGCSFLVETKSFISFLAKFEVFREWFFLSELTVAIVTARIATRTCGFEERARAVED
jgi:hypothetical protein